MIKFFVCLCCFLYSVVIANAEDWQHGDYFSEVEGVVLTPDGTKIVVQHVENDKILAVYDVATGKRTTILQTEQWPFSHINAMVISADNSTLAVAKSTQSNASIVSIYELTSGAFVHSFPCSAGSSVALTNDGSTIIIGSLTTASISLEYRATNSGVILFTTSLTVPPSTDTFSLSANGSILALYNSRFPDSLLFYNLSSGSVRSVSLAGILSSVVLSHDGQLCAVSYSNSTIVVIETASGSVINLLHHQINGNESPIFFNRNRNIALYGDSLAVWNLIGHVPPRLLPVSEWRYEATELFAAAADTSIFVHSFRKYELCAGTMPMPVAALRVVDTRVDSGIQILPARVPDYGHLTHIAESYLAVFSPDEQLIATLGTSPPIMIWDANTGAIKAELPATGFPVFTDRDSTILILNDREIREWNYYTGKILNTRILDMPDVAFYRTTPQQNRIAMVSDTVIVIWDYASDREVQRLFTEEKIEIMEFDNSGTKCMALTRYQHLFLWDISSGSLLFHKNLDSGASLGFIIHALAPDTQLAAISLPEKKDQIVLWDFRNDTIVATITYTPREYKQETYGFTSDSRYLIYIGFAHEIEYTGTHIHAFDVKKKTEDCLGHITYFRDLSLLAVTATGSHSLFKTCGPRLWHTKNCGITVSVQQAPSPDNSATPTLFPNPSSDRCSLRCAFLTPQNVEVSLFTALGESVYKPVNYRFSAGEHDLPLQLQGLASGMYFVRIQTDMGIELLPLFVQK